MALRARKFQQSLPIVDSQGRPLPEFLRMLNEQVDLVNAIAAANQAADNANQAAEAVTATSALANSYVDNPAPITVTDAGASVTITIAAHNRVYGDGTTVAVDAGGLTGRSYDTGYYIFYDDADRAGGAVTYQSSINPDDSAQIGARHSVGFAPPLAAADPPTPGGGVRPPGGSFYNPEP